MKRACQEPGCLTLLSCHNHSDKCFLHDKDYRAGTHLLDCFDAKTAGAMRGALSQANARQK